MKMSKFKIMLYESDVFFVRKLADFLSPDFFLKPDEQKQNRDKTCKRSSWNFSTKHSSFFVFSSTQLYLAVNWLISEHQVSPVSEFQAFLSHRCPCSNTVVTRGLLTYEL